MQLEEFIHQSLTQIISGIVKAQEEVKKTGVRVNPNLESAHNTKNNLLDDKASGGYNPIQNIDFDIAVTISEGSQDKLGGGIKIASFNIGGETKAENKNSTISRIKFTIPMAFP